MIPQDRRYTKDHEWVQWEDGVVRVGITHHAQHELGDVVFVELPKVGRKVEKGEIVATVESVKAVGEVFAPVSGEVIEVNQALTTTPTLVNKDPYGEGWLFRIAFAEEAEFGELMDAQGYAALLGAEK